MNCWLVAALFLVFSTQKLAYQDASDRVSGTLAGARGWQVRVADKPSARDKADRGPVVARVVSAERVDPITIGAVAQYVAANGDGVNRARKGDLLIQRQPLRRGFDAGLVHKVALFAPAAEESLPRAAFILPPPPSQTVAVAKPSKDAPKEEDTKTAADTVATETVALGYAGPVDDESSEVPFNAVIAKPGTVVLDPEVKPTHAWVNNAIPKSVHSKSERTCLAHAIYFEARGEPERGRIAVAQVVLNRLKNPAYPTTICGVVYQNKNWRNRCQFSFACDGRPERINNKSAWDKAQALAKRVLDDERTLYLSDVGPATHYHATYVRPRWARRMTKMDKIGRHIFYRTYKGGWS